MSLFSANESEFWYKRGGKGCLASLGLMSLAIILSLSACIIPVQFAFAGGRLLDTPSSEAANMDGIVLIGAFLLLPFLPTIIQYSWIRMKSGKPRFAWIIYSSRFGVLGVYSPDTRFTRSELLLYHFIPFFFVMILVNVCCYLYPYQFILIVIPYALTMLMLASRFLCLFWVLGHSPDSVYAEFSPGVITHISNW